MQDAVTTKFQIGSLMSLEQLEHQFAMLPSPSSPRGAARLRVDLNRENDILADIWYAILCGTLCRRSDTDVVFSFSKEENTSLQFITSLAGLATASIAKSIRPQSGTALDASAARHHLMLNQDGLVTPQSDTHQTLVEFDNDFSIAALLGGNIGTGFDLPLRRRLLENQILHFRKRLDLGALRRGRGPVREGPAGDLGQALAELHENAFEHGNRRGEHRLAGTRFLRIRTHQAASTTELADRCGPFRQLRHYVERTFQGGGSATLVEASVSDFGLGILDSFQSSPSGLGPNIDRREVLEALIYDRLTSKANDPSAGLGIQKALRAAGRMQAFVSLRTAEFWMAASFVGDEPNERLIHLGRKPHPSVTGTHWQILWPHY